MVWNGLFGLHLLIGPGLVLGSESQQGLKRRNWLLAPIMAKYEFIRKRLELIAVRARFSETLGAACPYTTNWGLLKQPDKHEATIRRRDFTGPKSETTGAGILEGELGDQGDDFVGLGLNVRRPSPQVNHIRCVVSVSMLTEGWDANAVRQTMTDWMRRVLENKRAARQRLQQLPFSEKLKLLEKLRERSLLIARSRPSARPVTLSHRSRPPT